MKEDAQLQIRLSALSGNLLALLAALIVPRKTRSGRDTKFVQI